MKLVLDTNIIVQAICSKGASHWILQQVFQQTFQLAVSHAVFQEYEAVLKRPVIRTKTTLSLQQIEDVLAALLEVASFQVIYFSWRPNLPDEKDNIFVELAFASQCDYLITSNSRDFQRAELKMDSFRIIAPGEFVKQWREKNE
jgi:putative PIN family toxin of toxin-antitoxin system